MAAIEEEEQFQRLCHVLSTYFFILNHSGSKKYFWNQGWLCYVV